MGCPSGPAAYFWPPAENAGAAAVVGSWLAVGGISAGVDSCGGIAAKPASPPDGATGAACATTESDCTYM